MVQITIRGKINFKGGPPNALPNPSRLRVEFRDTSLMDAPSKTLGKYVQDIKGDYKAGEPLKYSITTEMPKPMSHGYSMSAVLNVGWVPEEGGQDWLKQGDYLNDTSHSIAIMEGITEYEMDVEVIHYKH